MNHVVSASRQVGSTIKPFVYLTALDATLNNYKVATVNSIILDEPFSIALPNGNNWEPENYDRKFRGRVTLRYALEKSLNLPAVYIGQRVGFDNIANTIELFQIKDNVDAIPAITLGALETNLLSLTTAYASLANGGIYVEPRLFRSVVDNSGKVILRSEIKEKILSDHKAAYIVTNILQGVIERGTGQVVKRRGFTIPSAGKTGTSNDSRDSWFVGFTPKLAVGVWVGYDDNTPTGLTGASGAGVIWADFMNCAYQYLEPEKFIIPAGIEFIDIDLDSGLRASKYCQSNNIVKEVYINGTAPVAFCGQDNWGTKPDIKQITEPPPPPQPKKKFWDIIFG